MWSDKSEIAGASGNHFRQCIFKVQKTGVCEGAALGECDRKMGISRMYTPSGIGNRS